MPMHATELSEGFSAAVEAAGPSVTRVEGGGFRPRSGVAFAANLVVTTARGVEKDQSVVVTTHQGERQGRVRGKDSPTDLALVEVEGGLPVPRWDDGAGLRVGQIVLVLGRPGETVRACSGIVSALGKRPWRAEGGADIDRYLETDAPHRPGFSGGPLVGLEGEVLGITTTRLLSRVSVTIPTVTVRRVVSQLEAHGRVRGSYLGLKLQPVSLPKTVREETSEELGLMVLGVEPGGPADAAGVAFGDTVLHLGDDTVRTLDDLGAYLRADHVGQQVPVKLYRSGLGVRTLELTLAARP